MKNETEVVAFQSSQILTQVSVQASDKPSWLWMYHSASTFCITFHCLVFSHDLENVPSSTNRCVVVVVVPSVFCPSYQSWYSCSLGLLSSGLLWLDRHAVKKNGEGCKITVRHSSDHRFDLGSSSYLCNLHRLIAVKIPHLGCFVTGSSEDFTPILVKKNSTS